MQNQVYVCWILLIPTEQTEKQVDRRMGELLATHSQPLERLDQWTINNRVHSLGR